VKTLLLILCTAFLLSYFLTESKSQTTASVAQRDIDTVATKTLVTILVYDNNAVIKQVTDLCEVFHSTDHETEDSKEQAGMVLIRAYFLNIQKKQEKELVEKLEAISGVAAVKTKTEKNAERQLRCA